MVRTSFSQAKFTLHWAIVFTLKWLHIKKKLLVMMEFYSLLTMMLVRTLSQIELKNCLYSGHLTGVWFPRTLFCFRCESMLPKFWISKFWKSNVWISSPLHTPKKLMDPPNRLLLMSLVSTDSCQVMNVAQIITFVNITINLLRMFFKHWEMIKFTMADTKFSKILIFT